MMPTKDQIKIPYINIESLITASAALNQEYPIDPKVRPGLRQNKQLFETDSG